MGIQGKYRPNDRLALGAAYQLDVRGDRSSAYSELGVADGLELLGWVEPSRLPHVLAEGSVVLMPSRWEEAFGLVALEAALVGRPVVATRGGGLPEVVDDGVTYGAFVAALAPTLEGYPVLDYGEAASIANCSAQSNALLRWGVQRPAMGGADYDPRATPHLWGYARAAGMRVVQVVGRSGEPADPPPDRTVTKLGELPAAIASLENG